VQELGRPPDAQEASGFEALRQASVARQQDLFAKELERGSAISAQKGVAGAQVEGGQPSDRDGVEPAIGEVAEGLVLAPEVLETAAGPVDRLRPMPLPKPFFRFRPHPWHGLEPGPQVPELVTAYIEITPFDLMKYEIDKVTGYLRVDRPQRTSSLPPTLYGFVPRTYCGDRVAALSPGAVRGDGDPLDICVISERPIDRSEVLLTARVIGGLLMVDHGEADDKIVAVLEGDPVWSAVRELASLPEILVQRLVHYFNTYKLTPGQASPVSIDRIYGRESAYKVIEAALADYAEAVALEE
jgi:inorganic pyrophosphatase